MPMSQHPMLDSATELQEVINFDADDLLANKQGHLSPRQRDQLLDRQKRSLNLLMRVAGIVSLMILGAVLLGNWGIIVLGVMALILAIMAGVEYMVGYQTYTRDLNANHVETIQGIAHYVWRGDSIMGIETRPTGIRIGDEQFLLMEDQARAFIDGEIYAVHYAPATHTLLSAEQINLQSTPSTEVDDDEIAYWELVEADDQRQQQSGKTTQ